MLLAHIRLRAQPAESVSGRIVIARDVALFPLAVYSMRRGSDPSFTLAVQILRPPESRGFILNFLFGKTLRISSEAVVGLATDDPDTCPVRGAGEYISFAQAIEWDLSSGYLFSTPEQDGIRGTSWLVAKGMTQALQDHLQEAGPPTFFTMHSSE